MNRNTALAMEPVQIIDEIAWSNGGGREYNIRGRQLLSNQISETPNFNPDAVSRVRYDSANPLIGWTVNPNDGDLDTQFRVVGFCIDYQLC